MLQKDHDPRGKPLPRGASAGTPRGPGVTDETERKAAAGADEDARLREEPDEGTPREE